MILNFQDKKPKTKSITKGLYAIVIPNYIKRIEPDFMVLGDRGDWYRKLLDCDNTLAFQLMSNLKDESVVVFDSKKSEIDKNTILDFLDDNKKFKCPVLHMADIVHNDLMLNIDKTKEEEITNDKESV